jgi:GDPmannose 4,6-dehydratase
MRDFLERAFSMTNAYWQDHGELDPRYLRPGEIDCLLDDTAKARTNLGSRPTVDFDELGKIIPDADILAEQQNDNCF